MIVAKNRSTSITIDGKEYLYFGGSNYLGLAHRPELMSAAQSAFDQYGFSAGASRLTSGESRLLLELEDQLAALAKAESALVLPAGFMSNLAVVNGLDEQVDAWVVHKQAHGSIKSAVAASPKPMIEFDYDSEESCGSLAPDKSRQLRLGIFAEPVEPLSGKTFPIKQLVDFCTERDWLILDEAHSFGVLGAGGGGALEYFDLSSVNLVRTGTFSKAIGTQGGFVLASAQVIEAIKMCSPAYKLSTPLSPINCAATLEALRILRTEPATTIDLMRSNISSINKFLTEHGYPEFKNHPSPIFNLPFSESVRALREDLPDQGIYMPMVTAYFADYCDIGLRWTIQAGHTADHLDKLRTEFTKFL